MRAGLHRRRRHCNRLCTLQHGRRAMTGGVRGRPGCRSIRSWQVGDVETTITRRTMDQSPSRVASKASQREAVRRQAGQPTPTEASTLRPRAITSAISGPRRVIVHLKTPGFAAPVHCSVMSRSTNSRSIFVRFSPSQKSFQPDELSFSFGNIFVVPLNRFGFLDPAFDVCLFDFVSSRVDD